MGISKSNAASIQALLSDSSWNGQRLVHLDQIRKQTIPRYWSEDVVAGVIASVRAVLGVDDLHARTESQYPGGGRRASGEEQEIE